MHKNRTILTVTAYALGILGVSMIGTAQAQNAAEVRVRTGTHADYSRLVFDWPANVGYSVARDSDTTLSITFDKAAQLNTSAASSNPVANIKSLTVIANDPAKVTLTIPADSRIRDLRAGSKVVVDIYNPPGGASTPEPPKVVQAEPKPPAAPPQEVEQTSLEPAPLTPADTQEPVPEDIRAKENIAPEVVQLKPREKPTLITVSSTQNFGLAAFELADRLWIVNDKTDLLIKPQPSGPGADKLRQVNELSSDFGKAYIMNAKDVVEEGTKIKVDGGGILWRIGFDKFEDNRTAAEPIRKDVDRETARSGKLLWPLEGALTALDFKDPITGNTVKVITVDEAKYFAGPAREFVDFEVLHAPVGLAILPKAEDLEVKIVRGGVEISKPGGLSVVDEAIISGLPKSKNTSAEQSDDQDTAQSNGLRIFDFKAWQLGGLAAIPENKRVILASLNDESENIQGESMLTLGKMYLANGMGSESLGVLNYALSSRPNLLENPEFAALYGAASALVHHNEEAFFYLSQDILASFQEIQYWRAYILADVADWQQAASILPTEVGPLYDYPDLLQNELVPVLAEVALRDGNLPLAQELLAIAEGNSRSMRPPQLATYTYLLGEAARQKNQVDNTKELWEPLTTGTDDLYRAKAGLALTRLLVDEGELDTSDAIDQLERLRYAWRGDQLEVQINYWLGRTYFENGDYLRGLKIMRDAVSFDSSTPLGQRVAGEMADLFSGLFLSPELENVSPLTAVSLYDEFKELVPLDDSGDKIIERLAERLASADLLSRAGDLLQYQIDHRLSGSDIYRIAMRVAAIRLLDSQPDAAIAALDRAAQNLETLPEEFKTDRRYRDITMLRARALSRKGRADQALALLNDLDRTADMNRLRADIAWTAGYWDDAAEALGDVILDENISLTRPLEPAQTALLLQRAVALNLSSDRIALANMREKYSDLLAQTDKAKVFEVITRPRQSSALADRETLLSVVSEVDLFRDFLNSYKDVPAPVN